MLHVEVLGCQKFGKGSFNFGIDGHRCLVWYVPNIGHQDPWVKGLTDKDYLSTKTK